MKNYVLLLSLVFSFMGFAQDSTKTKAPKIIAKLGLGQKADLKGAEVRFEEVISDSRCPTGVTCVWAGEVKVLVSYMQDGERVKKEIVLGATNSSGNGKPIFNFENNEVFAYGIQPYPKISTKIKPSEYYLELYIQQQKD